MPPTKYIAPEKRRAVPPAPVPPPEEAPQPEVTPVVVAREPGQYIENPTKTELQFDVGGNTVRLPPFSLTPLAKFGELAELAGTLAIRCLRGKGVTIVTIP
jgi:hypothetical protein